MELEKRLEKYLGGISGAHQEAMALAQKRVDNLIKPPGSLGKLEDIAVKLAGITGKVKNSIGKKCVMILCSDNGVVEEGVASAPQEVTLGQTVNFTKGTTGVAVLAKKAGAELMVIDVGINADFTCEGVLNRKIRKSTNNIAKGPAMSREEALTAILTGIEAVKNAGEQGVSLIGVGEMGIGNTTTSSAVLCALTGCSAEKAAGKGAGLTPEAYRRKLEVVAGAVRINTPDPKDPVDIVAKVGGFDIAAMAGVYLGAAFYRVPVVIDGFISVCAAVLAYRLCPAARDFMFASHLSEEPGYLLFLKELELEAPLNMNMRLGEGSGCPLMFFLMESACAMMNHMATFDEGLPEVNGEYLDTISGADSFKV